MLVNLDGVFPRLYAVVARKAQDHEWREEDNCLEIRDGTLD